MMNYFAHAHAQYTRAAFLFVFVVWLDSRLHPEEVRQGQKVKDNDTKKLLRTAFLTFGPNAYCIPDLQI